jgi:hypothetical protein
MVDEDCVQVSVALVGVSWPICSTGVVTGRPAAAAAQAAEHPAISAQTNEATTSTTVDRFTDCLTC